MSEDIESRAGSSLSQRIKSAVSRPGTSSRPTSAKSALAWSDHKNNKENEQKDKEDDIEEEILIKGEGDIPKGCWYGFTNCMGGMWSTKQMAEDQDREIFVRTTIRELVIYCIFICLMIILTMGAASPVRYSFTNVFKQHMEKLDTVEQIPQMWKFLETEFIPFAYPQTWYNTCDDADVPCTCPHGKTKTGLCHLSTQDKNILFENKLLGVPRLRQIRIRGDSCTVHPMFSDNIKVCFGHYSPLVEDKQPFGPNILNKSVHMNQTLTGPDAWRYQSSKEIEGSTYWGKLATYGGGGSVQNLHTEMTKSRKIIKDLREALWVSRATRLVALDFAVYNQNVNLFCVMKLAFEFSPTGSIISSSTFRTVKLLGYVNAWDYLIFAVEIVFFLFTMYYVVEETIEIRHMRCEYFSDVWNLMDICVITVSLLTCALRVYINIVISSLLKPLLAEPEIFGDFSTLSYWNEMLNNIFAINVFISWVKIFKYISFNRTMQQLSDTLSRCAPDVGAFLIMFYIIFGAFAQLGYLLFGPMLSEYATYYDSCFTLMRAILGDFDFPALINASGNLGAAFFFLYIFIVFFILLNMFLAIINDTYSEVKAELAIAKVEFEITDYFMRGYNNMLGSFTLRNKMIDVENAIKLANQDGCITFEEIREALKHCDFSDVEIEMFFGNNDGDGDGTLDIKESTGAIEDLEEERPLSGKQARSAKSERIRSGRESRPGSGCPPDITTNDEFNELEGKVNKMEHSIGSIVSKIDAVLTKLERIEDRKRSAGNLGIIQEEKGNATFIDE